MAIRRADFGSMQMLDADPGELHLPARRNFIRLPQRECRLSRCRVG
jgi:hypothetical protein